MKINGLRSKKLQMAPAAARCNFRHKFFNAFGFSAITTGLDFSGTWVIANFRRWHRASNHKGRNQ